MDELQREALSFLIVEGRQRHNHAYRRSRIKALCAFLARCTPVQRRQIFDGVKEPASPYHGPKQETRYWFFQHPTFEVFERFCADEVICAIFADYLTLVESQPHNMSWSPGVCEIEALSQHYIRILSEFFFTFKPNGKHHYMTAPIFEITDGMKVRAYQRLKEEIHRRTMDKLRTSLGIPVDVRIYEEVFGLEPSPNAILFTVDEIVVEVPVETFVRVIPQGWISTVTLIGKHQNSLSEGVWPTFKIERVTEAAVAVSREKYRINEVGFEEVHRRYQSAMKPIHRIRRIHNGRLSIGIKIHTAQDAPKGLSLPKGMFRVPEGRTKEAFVLPAVGSIEHVVEMFESLEERTGISYLKTGRHAKSDDFQIQVCSPGQLNARRSALLGVSFYLGTDNLRRFAREDFVTTSLEYTGNRLIVYGAGQLDRFFSWWGVDRQGNLSVQDFFPRRLEGRTDVLMCQTLRDIDNINFVATLLVHAQYGGYWASLGEEFSHEMSQLLIRHGLAGILDAPWVKTEYASQVGASVDDERFFDALSEVMDYAFEDLDRGDRAKVRKDASRQYSGILYEVSDLLDYYRTEHALQASLLVLKGD